MIVGLLPIGSCSRSLGGKGLVAFDVIHCNISNGTISTVTNRMNNVPGAFVIRHGWSTTLFTAQIGLRLPQKRDLKPFNEKGVIYYT